MSSFLCDPQTIADAATALHYVSGQEARANVIELAYLNAAGYATRYEHHAETAGEVGEFREASHAFKLSSSKDPLRAYMALSCVLYQASEGNTPDSEPYKKWDSHLNDLAHSIAHRTCSDAGIEWDSRHA